MKRGLEILTFAKADHLGRESAPALSAPGGGKEVSQVFLFSTESVSWIL